MSESWNHLKRAARTDGPVEPAVVERVSEMLLAHRARRDGRDPPLLARARRLGPAVASRSPRRRSTPRAETVAEDFRERVRVRAMQSVEAFAEAAARDARRRRARDRARRGRRPPPGAGRARRRLPARPGATRCMASRVHDRARAEGRRRRARRSRARRRARGGAGVTRRCSTPPTLCGADGDLRARRRARRWRRWPSASRAMAPGRHDRRRGQRLRRRGQAPALRPRRHRPARRAVRGRRDRRRRPPTPSSSPPTCSARPSTGRPRRPC